MRHTKYPVDYIGHLFKKTDPRAFGGHLFHRILTETILELKQLSLASYQRLIILFLKKVWTERHLKVLVFISAQIYMPLSIKPILYVKVRHIICVTEHIVEFISKRIYQVILYIEFIIG